MYRMGERRPSQTPKAAMILPAILRGLQANRLEFARLELLAKEVDLFSNGSIFLHSLFKKLLIFFFGLQCLYQLVFMEGACITKDGILFCDIL